MNNTPGPPNLPARSKFWKMLLFAVVPAILLVILLIQWWGARAVRQDTAQSAVVKTPVPVQQPDTNVYAQLGGGSCQISKVVGFHGIENWGVWSSADPAELVLSQPVVGRLHMKIIAYTMNDHAAHKLNVTVGGETRIIDVPGVPSGVFNLDYSVATPATSIVLSGIKPRSARSAGLAPDDRAVGVGLVNVTCQSDASAN